MTEKIPSIKNIIVTAPGAYGEKLTRLFQQNNQKALHMPAIETFVNPNNDDLLHIIKNIENYPHIILPSQTAIDAFFLAYKQVNPLKNLQNTAFYAFGKDADYLEEKYHYRVPRRSQEPGPNGIVHIFKELQTKAPVVVVAPKVVGVPEPNIIPVFIKNLTSTGAKVIKIEGYITRTTDISQYQKAFRLIEKAGPDTLIAFSSTAEIMSVLKHFNPEHLNRMQTACFGPYTGNNAQKLGLHPVYVGKKYGNFADFVSGIRHL